MPTDKRERQRAGRDARREQARAAQKKAAQRRQIRSFVLLGLAVVGIGAAISLTGRGDDNAAAGPAAVSGEAAPCPASDGTAKRRTAFAGPIPECLDPAAEYTAAVETDKGTFTIDLDAKAAPKTVNNFVYLSRYKAYEGAPFHRVIPGFVVQGGDVANGDGTGDPGYAFADELPQAGAYKVGSVAMANSGANTNGSQFFVVTGDQGAALPPSYSLFGTVVDGLPVVKAIEADGSAGGTPTVTHVITKVTITEKKG